MFTWIINYNQKSQKWLLRILHRYIMIWMGGDMRGDKSSRYIFGGVLWASLDRLLRKTGSEKLRVKRVPHMRKLVNIDSMEITGINLDICIVLKLQMCNKELELAWQHFAEDGNNIVESSWHHQPIIARHKIIDELHATIKQYRHHKRQQRLDMTSEIDSLMYLLQ